ncbi:MAG: PDZ domain-containing protein [Proteobacteria bacterium]|nr:PDZ domain-containing protein [Pseudomonadota bacterium]
MKKIFVSMVLAGLTANISPFFADVAGAQKISELPPQAAQEIKEPLYFSPKNDMPEDAKKLIRELNAFGLAFQHIKEKAVAPHDYEEMRIKALRYILKEFDPHSEYLTPEEYKAQIKHLDGRFAGIGAALWLDDKRLTVEKVIEDGPAYKAGMQSGDVITHIDGAPVDSEKNLSAIVSAFDGEVGSRIAVTIAREKGKEPVSLTLIRDIVTLNPVSSATFGEGKKKIGYARLDAFTDGASEHLQKAYEGMESAENPPAAYILDLRNNGGGSLVEAAKTVALFVDPYVDGNKSVGKPLVFVRGRGHKETFLTIPRVQENGTSIPNLSAALTSAGEIHRAVHAKDILKGKPMIVLINGNTASAAEIVAGDLQIFLRAVPTGTRTFGKGSVQSIIPLTSSSDVDGEEKEANLGALRLTIALYHMANGISPQGIGIIPSMEIAEDLRLQNPNSSKEADYKNALVVDGQIDNSASVKSPASCALRPGVDEKKAASAAFIATATDWKTGADSKYVDTALACAVEALQDEYRLTEIKFHNIKSTGSGIDLTN